MSGLRIAAVLLPIVAHGAARAAPRRAAPRARSQALPARRRHARAARATRDTAARDARERRARRAAPQPRRPARDARPRRRAARRGRRPGGLLDPDTGRLLLIVAARARGRRAARRPPAPAGSRVRRARRRRSRRYGLYELRLSTHDEAKPQDLEDMVEAIANLVRAFPVERARDGQPHVGVELRLRSRRATRAAGAEVEWSLNVRCEPALVGALDAAINAAYPDVRLGREHGQPPQPAPTRSASRGTCCASASSAASSTRCWPPTTRSPRRRWSRSRSPRSRSRAASVVRFQLTPAPTWFEALARRLYRRHENRLVRAERWGLREGGLTSTLNRAEMRNAEQTQNRSLFWLELVVAADSPRRLPDARRRRPGPPRREPPAPPLHARAPQPLPPPLPGRARAARALAARAGLRGRGRAPARAALRAHEGRAGPPRHRPAHPRAARGAARRRPRPDRRARRADDRRLAGAPEPTASAA